VSDPTAEFNRELTALEGDLKRLESEYNMYFAGRLKRPPWETRARVEATVKRLDRTSINNYGVRFRFTTLQTRFSRFIDLWDRALRAREEGRPGPLMQPRKDAVEPTRPDRLEAMVFGVADYAASVQARTTNIGGANPDYAVLTDPDAAGARETHWGDQWHFGISRMVAACRAEGLRPIDGPFGDYNDADGYRAAARSRGEAKLLRR